VSTFCGEQGISRTSFEELRKRARLDGPAAVSASIAAKS
jgi:putative transposase